MLRKKLSKLIVGIMAAVMVTVGGSGVGQAVFANSSNGAITTQAIRVVNIHANTMEAEIINHIKDITVSTLKVTGDVILTKDIEIGRAHV